MEIKFPTMDDLIKISAEQFKGYPILRRNPRNVTSLRLFPLEFHENSIVVKGFTLHESQVPGHVTFSKRDKHTELGVVDSLITPEVAILYFNRNPKKYQKCKKITLTTYFTVQGIFSQVESLKDIYGR